MQPIGISQADEYYKNLVDNCFDMYHYNFVDKNCIGAATTVDDLSRRRTLVDFKIAECAEFAPRQISAVGYITVKNDDASV